MGGISQHLTCLEKRMRTDSAANSCSVRKTRLFNSPSFMTVVLGSGIVLSLMVI